MTATQLPKTQAATLEAIRNLPADARFGQVEIGISYSGYAEYKGVNCQAVIALVAKGLLVRDAAGKVSIPS